MDHYVDIDVRSDPEFAAYQLMNALYAKLHRALVAQACTSIGVSFPKADGHELHLGRCLRLHGSLAALSALQASSWLKGMHDHIVLTPVMPVPAAHSHLAVRRVQVKSNPERMRRRLMRRLGFDENQAHLKIPDSSAAKLNLPCIALRSTSTGQAFNLYIDHSQELPAAVSGTFNTYGLSQSATVPMF